MLRAGVGSAIQAADIAELAGKLPNQETFSWGTLKGVGKVYVQVIVEVSCSFAFSKVYTSKAPITAWELVHDRVLPFYENLAITVGAVLTATAGANSSASPRRIPTSGATAPLLFHFEAPAVPPVPVAPAPPALPPSAHTRTSDPVQTEVRLRALRRRR